MSHGAANGEPSFEEWVRHCFEHAFSPSETSWYHDIDAPDCPLTATTAVDYLTRLFSAPSATIGHFTDDQLYQGLCYIADNGASDYALALVDPSVQEDARVACVQSILRLFADLFDARCTNVLSTGQPSGRRPDGKWHVGEISRLNTVCYMGWDVLPICGEPDDPTRQRLDSAAIGVMERSLLLSSIACQESALHGLGHWAIYYPGRVRTVIASFLRRVPPSYPLRTYAECAAAGMVL